MIWKLLKFASDAKRLVKQHAVPAELAEHLRTDLFARGFEVPEVSEVAEFSLDLGGSVIQGEPSETFDVDGLELTLWCAQVELFADQIIQLPRRHFGGLHQPGYFKLHGAYTCLVLTPNQRRQLRDDLATRIELANQRSDAFLHTWKNKGSA